MTEEQVRKLIDKYNSGIATKAEGAFLKYWFINEATSNGEVFTEQERIEMEQQIWLTLQQNNRGVKAARLWPRIAGAAAAIAIIVFGLYFYNNGNLINKSQQTAVVNDVNPGKVGATLTLANGEKIALSNAMNGELAKEAGVVISKSASGEIIYEMTGSASEPNKTNTLSTSKGETYRVRLPDGSLVYLNAASSLTYAASLMDKGERVVGLQGEGYFEIAKDKKHPFIVMTDKQKVEVLGTHFNINSYADEYSTKTTLLEGSVRVVTLGISKILNPKSKTINLLPNQQSVLSKENQLEIIEVNAADVVDWKNGEFIFNDETLESVMRKVSRWYNVDIVYQDEALKAQTFGGSISRFSNVSKVLDMLQRTKTVKFKIEGNKVIVMKS